MTVIANIDISSPTGRKLVRELEKHKRVVKLTYPETGEILEGYMTSEEFRKRAMVKVRNFCDDNGII